MRIFVPSAVREEFTYFLMDRVYADKSANFNYTDRSANGVFACFEWEDESISYDYVKEVWNDFTKKWDCGAVIQRMEYTLEDGSIVICPNNSFLTVHKGNVTDRYNAEEPIWRDKVEEVVNGLNFDAPFVVEFNSPAVQMKRNVPTISLCGREIWRNNGERKTTSDFYPVMFRHMANLIYMPNYVEEAERLSFYYNEPEECIITSFCIIKRNAKGFGNTVFLRNVSFNSVEVVGAKHINEILEDTLFWNNILIPLATEKFEVLKAELESQVTPIAIQLRYFKLQSKTALREEINRVQTQKIEAQNKINSLVRSITDQKIQIGELDEVLQEKKSILEKGLATQGMEDEFKRIISLPYIEKVLFLGTTVEFTTKPIPIDEYGPVLGGYKITYNVQDKFLNIHNNVNPTDGLAHPHIYQDGEICFGNYSDIFFRFQTGEYLVGLELLHEFLSTYNPEDEWGRRLLYWDANFVFEDMRERGLEDCIEPEWDEAYYDRYGEHLPSANVCPDCGEHADDCTCHRCQYCGRHEDDCECWICPECGREVGNDCRCDRCESCNELIGDCECDRCDECGELLDPYDQYTHHCTCERCPDDYDIYVDTDEGGCCTECETWDCEHNCNEHHAMTQEETLFDELEEAV
jgi:hypothetical protein